MSADRTEILKNLVAQNPQDSFARYGLAMEYSKAGRLEEAVVEYRALLSFNPDYLYAYFHCGQALEKLGLVEEARAVYRNGIEAAGRRGDGHASGELQAALDQLG